MVERLPEKGAEVNAGSEDGVTALHFAVMAGHANVVKLLIANNTLVRQQQILHASALDTLAAP